MKAKTLVFYCMLLLSGCVGQAQNAPGIAAKANPQAIPETTTYPMPPGKKATFKLPYAHEIRVKTWDKPELQFRAIVQALDDESRKIHTINVSDGSGELRIETDFDQSKWQKRDFCCWSDLCDSLLRLGSKVPTETSEVLPFLCLRVDYELLMPAGTALALETISGDIEIRGLTGEVKAKTISGFVDIDRNPAVASDLHFSSVTGEIYTDFDIELDDGSSAYHKNVRTRLNGGGQRVSAETVSGDIFFRKR